MKKVAVVVFLGMVLSWIFYPSEKIEKKELPLTVWKIDKIVAAKKIIVVNKEQNISIVNKKPTVSAYGFTIASVGDTIIFHSKAKDEDGNITAYLWKEGEKILGSKSELSFIFAKEGEHTLTLRVTDNLGAIAKSSVVVDVYAEADKKVYYKHRGCGCQSKTYTYYNSEGNISQLIS